MATTTLTQVIPPSTTDSTVHAKIRYIPSGHTPEPSPHNFHLPAIAEFGDVRRLPLRDMRPLPTAEELPKAPKGTAQLSTHGFTAIRYPTSMHLSPYSPSSWKNAKLLEELYVPETEEMVKKVTGAKTVVTEALLLRSAIWSEEDALATHAGHGKQKTQQEIEKETEEMNMHFPQFIGFSPVTGGASPAPKVHLDYAPNGAREHIRKYHPKLTAASSDIIAAEERLLAANKSLRYDYAASGEGPRWALYSIWRPIKPVKRDPLALGDARSFAEEDYIPIDVKAPNLGVPGTNTHNVESYLGRGSQSHEWYWVSNQKPEEVLVINLFDSDKEKETVAAGGTLHSSVELDNTEIEEARESLELRCLAIW